MCHLATKKLANLLISDVFHSSLGSAIHQQQAAEVEVEKDGSVRVRRVVCAMDCGTVVNPDTVRAQLQSGTNFGVTAALHGEITIRDGRVE